MASNGELVVVMEGEHFGFTGTLVGWQGTDTAIVANDTTCLAVPANAIVAKHSNYVRARGSRTSQSSQRRR